MRPIRLSHIIAFVATIALFSPLLEAQPGGGPGGSGEPEEPGGEGGGYPPGGSGEGTEGGGSGGGNASGMYIWFDNVKRKNR